MAKTVCVLSSRLRDRTSVGTDITLRPSEPLGNTGQDGAAQAILRGADAHARAVADLVDRVPHVQDIQPQFGPRRQLLHHRQVDRTVGRERDAVRDRRLCWRADPLCSSASAENRVGWSVSRFSV